jgi:hypothetical protein
MPNKWPDFLFTAAIRFVSGAVSGVIIGFLVCTPLSGAATRYYPLLVWLFGDQAHPHRWVLLWSLVGGIIGVLTTPRWQTPWYKRDPEESSVLTELETPDAGWVGPGTTVKTIVSKSVEIKTIGADGERHNYSSMEQVPPEIRSEIEALEKEAARQTGDVLSLTEHSQTGNTSISKIIHRKNVTVYKTVDRSGVERVYHSLDEMPPEARAAIAEAQNKLKGGQGGV